MDNIQCAGKTVAVDTDGFLVDQNDWDEDVAMALARREGFDDLDREQFEIVQFMRNYYQKFHAFPILSYVCKNIHEPKNCVNEEFINPMKAWKIAGLPKPDGIEFVALDGKHYIMQECC
ncbi:MAG: TusE/DsrC/DsvC family sulfur relay protein [Desulfobulbaceae bacterium]|nr:TusE/DsrC/DsvC family sulfur relay protein [Desulfobulbaceae bacterium]